MPHILAKPKISLIQLFSKSENSIFHFFSLHMRKKKKKQALQSLGKIEGIQNASF